MMYNYWFCLAQEENSEDISSWREQNSSLAVLKDSKNIT